MSDSGEGILLLIESIDRRLGTMDEKLGSIVGVDRCTSYREKCQTDNEIKFSDLYEKYNAVHEVCTRVDTKQESQATKEDLVRTERAAYDAARLSDEDYARKMADSIRSELMKMSWCTIKDIMKNSRVAQVVIGLFLIDSGGIIIGRLFNLYQFLAYHR
jgi:hypothetical protein